jgi:DNA-binding HxlR family transcriptional regulator
VKIEEIINKPAIKILLFINKEKEVRYTNFTDLINSRGTLSTNLRSLDEKGLIKRKVVSTKPIKSFYSLTNKGEQVAKHLDEIKKILF